MKRPWGLGDDGAFGTNLDREYPGAARVAVVQDGTMQYMKRPGG